MNLIRSEPFEFHSFKGSFKDIGYQYGEACESDIKNHLKLIKNHLYRKEPSLTIGQLERISISYQKSVVEFTPHFNEMLKGLSLGANIHLWEAYLLQLRAEVNKNIDRFNHECTVFTFLSNDNSNENLIAQNVDLPSYYKGMFKVIEMIPDGYPKILFLTPVGQISHIGINEYGLGVVGNFIASDKWRLGIPRYMYSFIALLQKDIADVEKELLKVRRASSRNIMLLQKDKAINLEILPSMISKNEIVKDYLVHTNHIVSDKLKSFDLKEGEDLLNSEIRKFRAEKMLHEGNGHFDFNDARNLLSNREDFPHSICRNQSDFGEGKTVASFISKPANNEIYVAPGGPDKNDYVRYSFT